MKSKLNLMTALVGLAMLATPLTAAAYDHNFNKSHAARAERSFAAAHPIAAARVDRAVRDTAIARHDWRANHTWGAADEYRNYGNPGYTGYATAPAYVQAPTYV